MGEAVSAAIAETARLDCFLRLQLEEQNQSRHHKNLRDRALGNMILVTAALLAILGALYQAKLEDNPTIFRYGTQVIPVLIALFGAVSCLQCIRHSLQASRHWSLARFYRDQAFALMDRGLVAEAGVAHGRAAASKAFARSGLMIRCFEWADGPQGRGTRILYTFLPILVMGMGALLLLAVHESRKNDRELPPRPADMRVIVDQDPSQPMMRRPLTDRVTAPPMR